MFNQRARSFVTGCVGCGELRNAFFHRFTRALATSPPAVKDTTPRDFEQIPSPKGLPFIGTTFSLLLAGGPTQLHKYMDRRHKELGPIFKDNVGPVTAVFLSDAEEMRNVFAKEGKYPVHIKPESWLIYNEKHGCSRGLFFMDGEEWLLYRRIMNNLLLKGDLSWLENSCYFASDLLLDRINTYADKEFPNLDNELYKWSMDVMVAILVGPETYKKISKDLEPLVSKLAIKVFSVFETTVHLQLISAKLAEKYQIGRWKRFELSVTEALEAASEVLEYVHKNFKETDGLLGKMVSADIDKTALKKIVIDLMLGAADTTANTMAWSLYLLGKHTNIQSQLREDLRKTEKPPLLRNIIRETLRLYPPAPFLTRFLPDAATVCGYNIPPSTLIVMSIYTSGRDPKYFQDADKFQPNRWLRENGVNFSKVSATLPFGIGSRSCIGKRIAEVQLQDVLQKAVKNFKLNLKNDEEIKDVVKMITKPSKPIRLVFNKFSM